MCVYKRLSQELPGWAVVILASKRGMFSTRLPVVKQRFYLSIQVNLKNEPSYFIISGDPKVDPQMVISFKN